MDISLTGDVFTDYNLTNVGASAFQLEHDWFVKQDLLIRTAAAGGGTLLIENDDYTLGTESTELSTRVTAVSGPGHNVFHTVTIINVTYQTGNLYFSGKYIADSNSAADIDALDDATSLATADTLVLRDASGRAQVAAPSAAADIARKDTVDAHADLTTAHGAVSAPTASKMMVRDTSGRAQVAAPSADADIANKSYVDDLAGAGRTTETVKANADAVATKVPTTRQIIAGTGLSGGGDLSADRTLALAIRVYDTGWINRSDWTNVHLGSDTTLNADSNVTHNLNAPLSSLLVKVFVSTDGTDANSFEIQPFFADGIGNLGHSILAVDNNNVRIQTGSAGLYYVNDSATGVIIDTEDWYYKVKVWFLG